MPRLNPRAEVTSGDLGPPIVVGGVTVYGGVAWVDDDRTINQVCDGSGEAGCVIRTLTTRTGEVETVSERGANFIVANGGLWAAYLSGYGSYTSSGARYPYVGAVGPDGSYAVKAGGAGPWDVYDRTGHWLYRLTDGDAFDLQLLSDGCAIWRPSPQPEAPILTRGVPVPQTIGPCYGVQMILVAGRWWAMYQSGRVVVHPHDAPGAGYDVTTGDSYGRDLVLVPGNNPRLVRLTWSDSPAQNQGSVRVLDLALDESHTNPEPPDPPKPEPPDPAPIPPTPEPTPPKEPTMIAYSAPVPGFLAGTLEPHPDGGDAVAIRKPNGKIVCCTPEGQIEERDSPGAWEKFRKSGGKLIAERDGDRVYVLGLAE